LISPKAASVFILNKHNKIKLGYSARFPCDGYDIAFSKLVMKLKTRVCGYNGTSTGFHHSDLY